MLSVVMYGRNDSYGYNLHRRAAISLNCIAAVLGDPDDEILFVDYNTPDDMPTFLEAIGDTLTEKAKRLTRIFRARPRIHDPYREKTQTAALESLSRNIAIRRSNPRNRWVLSTNTDMIFTPRDGRGTLDAIAGGLEDGFYQLPRFELPETLWESFDRLDPQGTIAAVERYSARLHLNDVIGNERTLFDGPGDFQLMLRQDIIDIDGFDEEMIHGWHVDANLCRRMILLRGPIRSALDQVFGYHCDHTRQAGAAHAFGRVENDIKRKVDGVMQPDLPAQRRSWGLPDEPIEEISLQSTAAAGYVKALEAAIPAPAPRPYYEGDYTEASHNDLDYAPEHVLPFLADLVATLPRSQHLAWFGCRPAMLTLACRAWAALGFTSRLLVSDQIAGWLAASDELRAAVEIVPEAVAIEKATVFAFEFGFGTADDPAATLRSRKQAWVNDDVERLVAVKQAFDRVCDVEESRPAEPRRCIVINVVNNYFEDVVGARLATNYTPYSTRLRHGFVLRPGVTAKDRYDLRTIAGWLTRKLGRHRGIDGSEVNVVIRHTLDMLEATRLGFQVPAGAARAAALIEPFLDFPEVGGLLGASPAEIDGLRRSIGTARTSRQYTLSTASTAAEGSERGLSAVASIRDWENPEWLAFATRFYGGRGAYDYFQRDRNAWERVQVLYGLSKLGLLREDKRAIVRVNDPDGIYTILSEHVAKVRVEVQDPKHGDAIGLPGDKWWRVRELCMPRRLEFVNASSGTAPTEDLYDMVLMPQSAALRDGVTGLFGCLEAVASRLRIGGVIAMSVEMMLDRGSDFHWPGTELPGSSLVTERLAAEMGLELIGPFAGGVDAGTLDRCIEPSEEKALREGFFVFDEPRALHSVAVLFFRKTAEARPNAAATLFPELLGSLASGVFEQMSIKEHAARRDGGVRITAKAPSGHFLYGPYIRMPAGRYRLAFKVEASGVRNSADPVLTVDAVAGDRELGMASYKADAVGGSPELAFEMPPELALGTAGAAPVEFRFSSHGNADLCVRAIELQRDTGVAGLVRDAASLAERARRGVGRWLGGR